MTVERAVGAGRRTPHGLPGIEDIAGYKRRPLIMVHLMLSKCR